MPCRARSEATAQQIDEAARAIVDAAFERTTQLLKDKWDKLESVRVCMRACTHARA